MGEKFPGIRRLGAVNHDRHRRNRLQRPPAMGSDELFAANRAERIAMRVVISVETPIPAFGEFANVVQHAAFTLNA